MFRASIEVGKKKKKTNQQCENRNRQCYSSQLRHDLYLYISFEYLLHESRDDEKKPLIARFSRKEKAKGRNIASESEPLWFNQNVNSSPSSTCSSITLILVLTEALKPLSSALWSRKCYGGDQQYIGPFYIFIRAIAPALSCMCCVRRCRSIYFETMRTKAKNIITKSTKPTAHTTAHYSIHVWPRQFDSFVEHAASLWMNEGKNQQKTNR